ncbi:MAG: hypothetical protein LC708_00155, partial [Actinobacteria bacterium]|nr:hypothetical protein [Actinomycetota bacterium]
MARIIGALLMVWGTLIAVAGPASAGVFFGAGPNFNNGVPVKVGDVMKFATVTVRNNSDGPEAAGDVLVSQITLIPSCGTTNPGDTACLQPGAADPGVFTLVGPFTGEAGTACAGRTFSVSTIDATTGQILFTPNSIPGDGTNIRLSPFGTANDTCRIDFFFNVNKVPKDAVPGDGPQTRQFVTATGTSVVTGTQGTSTGSGLLTVNAATPTIQTAVTAASVPIGTPISDTATIAGGGGPGPGPTGTIVFQVFGPNDPACANPPAFTFAAVLVAGNATYASPPVPGFVPTAAGTYQFVATYSGDINNTGVASICGAEAVVVTMATPGLTTTASPAVPIGGSIHDTANLTGGSNPTGTITFNLYGPADPTCAGAPLAQFPVAVMGAGAYNSPNFVVTQPGTYRFTATYGGDANNVAVGPTACADPGESVTILANPQITTVASPSVPVGGMISDTATIFGGIAPTGTVTFNLYGPADVACAAPIATSTVPLMGAGAVSATFTVGTTAPFSGAGTYRFRATYSGDTQNNPAGPTACNDPLEAVVVTPVNPVITTTASASVPVGGTVTDTATLTGGAGPTGTITFNLYGPTDPNCLGAPVFTSTVPVVAAGAVSAPFVLPSSPTTGPGTYHFTASYSGDANNNPAGPTACNAPNESIVVTPIQPLITTNASASVPVGGTISDTAHLTGGGTGAFAPTGTITFNLFFNDAACVTPTVQSVS